MTATIETAATPNSAHDFVVDLDGFEGPIDVLLALAREHKVDLAQIPIVPLADQYLAFIAAARGANLELAAEYLVMAAWLAYLKSRLLLPKLADDEEPSGEALAAALAFQMRRLEAMQSAGAGLLKRHQLGRDVFARGAPERLQADPETVVEATLYDLLKAYADQRRRRHQAAPLRFKAWDLHTVDDAIERLRRSLGGAPDWMSLWAFLPPGIRREAGHDDLGARSAVATTFAAGLELAKQGDLRLRQDAPFGEIHVRRTASKDGPR